MTTTDELKSPVTNERFTFVELAISVGASGDNVLKNGYIETFIKHV